MRKLLSLLLFVPLSSIAQDFRFLVEKSCFSAGSELVFKCVDERQEFVITKSGLKFSGRHPDGGPKQDLSILNATPHIVVLNYPVSYDGTSIVHLTDNYSRFYWVSVAYSTYSNEREVAIYSGKRVR